MVNTGSRPDRNRAGKVTGSTRGKDIGGTESTGSGADVPGHADTLAALRAAREGKRKPRGWRRTAAVAVCSAAASAAVVLLVTTPWNNGDRPVTAAGSEPSAEADPPAESTTDGEGDRAEVESSAAGSADTGTWPREVAMNDTVSLASPKHEVTGEARLLQNPDGSQVVELTDFSITNWRDDLFVFAVKGEEPREPKGGVRLGYLEDGDKATRRFDVPEGTLLSKPFTVMVWCDGAVMPLAVSDMPFG